MSQPRTGSRRVHRPAFALVAGLLVLALCAFAAQAPASAPAAQTVPAQAALAKDAAPAFPAFEVVSIKPDKSGSMMIRIMFTPDGISVSGMPVHMLVREALNISDSQLIGEPGDAIVIDRIEQPSPN